MRKPLRMSLTSVWFLMTIVSMYMAFMLFWLRVNFPGINQEPTKTPPQISSFNFIQFPINFLHGFVQLYRDEIAYAYLGLGFLIGFIYVMIEVWHSTWFTTSSPYQSEDEDTLDEQDEGDRQKED